MLGSKDSSFVEYPRVPKKCGSKLMVKVTSCTPLNHNSLRAICAQHKRSTNKATRAGPLSFRSKMRSFSPSHSTSWDERNQAGNPQQL